MVTSNQPKGHVSKQDVCALSATAAASAPPQPRQPRPLTVRSERRYWGHAPRTPPPRPRRLDGLGLLRYPRGHLGVRDRAAGGRPASMRSATGARPPRTALVGCGDYIDRGGDVRGLVRSCAGCRRGCGRRRCGAAGPRQPRSACRSWSARATTNGWRHGSSTAARPPLLRLRLQRR